MPIVDKELLETVNEQIKWADSTGALAEFIEELAEEKEKKYWYTIAKSLEMIRIDLNLLYDALLKYQEYEIKQEIERKYEWKNRETQAK